MCKIHEYTYLIGKDNQNKSFQEHTYRSSKGSKTEIPPTFRNDLDTETGQTDNVSIPLSCKTTPLCTIPYSPAATFGIACRETIA